MSRPPVWRDDRGPAGSLLPQESRDTGKGSPGADALAEKASAPEESLKKQVVDLWTQKRELGEKNYKLEMENKLLRTAKEVQQDKNAGLEREKEGLKQENAELAKEIAELRSAKVEQDQKNAALWKKVTDQDARIASRDKENAALRTEVSDLKAANVERDWKDKARDGKLADLEARFDKLGSEYGDSAGELPKNTSIDGRTTGGATREAKAERPQRGWHLPSDAANNVVATAIGVGVALDHVPHNAADYGGIGVTVTALGVAGVAWVREHMRNRKAKNDAGDRPQG